MGTVGNLANQVNNLSPCTSQNCCQKIDDLQGKLFGLVGRIEALERGEGKANQAFQKAEEALNALNPIRQDAARALDLGNNNAGELFALELAIKGLGSSVAYLTDLGGQAFKAAQQAANVAGDAVSSAFDATQKAIGEANSALAKAIEALNAAAAAGAKADNSLFQSAQAQLEAYEAKLLASSASSEANRAVNAASNAQNTADRAGAAAFNAQGTADRAAGAASNAQSTADRAAGAAANAQRTADAAAGAAANAQRTADAAAGAAEIAQSTADFGVDAASNAQSTADRAAGAAGKAQRAADAAAGAAGKAQRTADTAAGAAGKAQRTADAAAGAAGKAQRAADAAASASGRDGEDGKDGRDGRDGKDGKDGKNADPTLPIRVNAIESQIASINSRADNSAVNPADKAEILQAIGAVGAGVQAMPETLARNPTFKAAATSAAATGACQASRPGGCNGGLPDQLGGLTNTILNGISAASSTLNTQILMPITRSLDTVTKIVQRIDKSVGVPVVGTLSTWAAATAEVVNRSQIVNILTYMSVLHNAYMLSNGLTQTLFSAVSNSLSALGIKDTSADPAGVPWDVGKIVDQWLEGFFKSVFGVAVVDGIKADWKKYNRIYQAAANVIYSLQSISHSILGALEVVGSHVAKIGNGLQKFRAVGERAYGWMNDRPFFQNRFFTAFTTAQETLNSVDQAASSVVSIQESFTQLATQKQELEKSISENPEGKKADAQPEAADTKAKADAAKLASKSPDIAESDQVKP